MTPPDDSDYDIQDIPLDQDWARRHLHDGFEAAPDPVGMSDAYARAGTGESECRERWLGSHVVRTWPAVNRRLEPHPPLLRASPTDAAADAVYRLPDEARGVLEHLREQWAARGRSIRNDPKIRLVTDPAVQDGEWTDLGSWFVQQATYFDSQVTNDWVTKRAVHTTAGTEWQTRDLMTRDGGLVSLHDSRLSNQLGASTLLILPDGRIPFVKAGAVNNIDPNRLAPTGSGSADAWHDAGSLAAVRNGEVTALDLARRNMERELLEEFVGVGVEVDAAGVDAARAEHGLASRVVGFARYVHRGGKPEFLGLTFTDQALVDKISATEQALATGFEYHQTPLRGRHATGDQLRGFLTSLQQAHATWRDRWSCSAWVCVFTVAEFVSAVLERHGSDSGPVDLLDPALLE